MSELISLVVKMVQRVLVKSLGAGSVNGLLANELDSDLNL